MAASISGVAEDSTAVAPGIFNLPKGPNAQKILLALAAAVVVAVMAGVWIWGQQPEYKVLFANFSDRDGGSIVAALEQMNVPYKLSEGGGVILVPAAQVHDIRLKLATQGLPKSGNVGFELMENQKLGVSQFLEQVNFQRALEGELARSVESLSAVQAARVHLALPKSSVFVREQQKPTASILLNLHPGRTLDPQQVSAIVHLVASSVPDLPTGNVTVVDQNGNLLSDTSKNAANAGLDASQLKYVQQVQQDIVKRIESILKPIVGASNVRAEATADVDFSRTEQAAELYKPNQTGEGAIRSSAISESQTPNGSGNANGIPGALTNQPPAPSTAPINAPANAAATSGASAPGSATTSATTTPVATHKDATINYEVDKTIRYTQQAMGGIRRLNVAVVVNYKTTKDAAGKLTSKALTEAEKTQITDLVKEAMGYNKDRGDSLNVVNSPFADAQGEDLGDVPVWKNPEYIGLAKEIGRYLLIAAVLAYLFFAYLRPLLKKFNKGFHKVTALPGEKIEGEEMDDADVQISADGTASAATLTDGRVRTYLHNLEHAKQLAKQDPKIVANVVKGWVNGNE